MTDKPIAKMSFEEALSELETLVEKLESAQVPLEQSIEMSKRGQELRAFCETKLAEAEEKIAQITLDKNGQATGTKTFEG